MKNTQKTILTLSIALNLAAVAAGGYWYTQNQLSTKTPVAETATPAAAESQIPRFAVGDLEVGVQVNPSTPQVGDNAIRIEVRNKQGEAVGSAEVIANADMPAMGAMPAMRAPAGLEQIEPGVYTGEMDLTMRGEWPLTILIEDEAYGSHRLLFDLATDREGMSITAGGISLDAAKNTSAPAMAKSDEMPRFNAGEFEIAIETQPPVPVAGSNKLIIELRDQQGNAVTGAVIDANAEMPAMGAMPAMRAPAGMEEVAPGRYEGEVDLSMRGEWPLSVMIAASDGEERRLQFDYATDREGINITSGGAPVGGQVSTVQAENAILVDNRRRQLIGVETEAASFRSLNRTIRAVGEVSYDERLLSEITLKFDGFIGDLHANYVGAPIQQGQALFTVYSPELLAAQQEYLETLKRRSHRNNDPLIRAAKQRLSLWGMANGDIRSLERRKVPQEYVAIRAPQTGTLIERHVTAGGSALMGSTLLRIADLSKVWIEAEVFEQDLEFLQEGMMATVTLPYVPDRSYEARIEYIFPFLDSQSRTGRIRLTLDNSDGSLKPEMYAEVSLHTRLGERLSVPEEAVIVAGDSRVVFVDLGDGRLNPTRIKTGRRAEGYVEVLEGLKPNDQVVTSGNFLVAAETQLRTGIKQW